MNGSLVPSERIENIIYIIRGQRVMLDRDLAALYGVETKNLNKAVKRNAKRFPEDFMFQLTWEEVQSLRSQFVTLKDPRNDSSGFQIGTLNEKISHERGKNVKYLFYAFTEHGAVMAANVLRSERAISMSIEVVRAFIHLRRVLTSQKEVIKEVAELKSFVLKHAQKSDQEFRKLWQAIEKLSNPPQEQRQIGFDLS